MIENIREHSSQNSWSIFQSLQYHDVVCNIQYLTYRIFPQPGLSITFIKIISVSVTAVEKLSANKTFFLLCSIFCELTILEQLCSKRDELDKSCGIGVAAQ